VSELPVGEWVHLAFVFSNDSAGLRDYVNGDESVQFAMAVFVNGRLDVAVKFRLPVLANDGPLMFGACQARRRAQSGGRADWLASF
jgi:hypothetical protein